MKLLHIIASPRGDKSKTLHIAQDFLESLALQQPDLKVEHLDLFNAHLPELTGTVVDAKYTLLSGGTLDTTAQHGWSEVVEHAQTFLDFDAYLISSPMWNFSIPYQLKHYIDIIMQPGILFRFTANGVEGLARDKKMYCITARGSDYSQNSHLFPYDFQEPYLRSIFGMAGIYDITFINAQPMDYSPELTELHLQKAKEDAKLMAMADAL